MCSISEFVCGFPSLLGCADYLLPQFHGLRLALSPLRSHLLRCVSTESRVSPPPYLVRNDYYHRLPDIGVSSASIRFYFPRSLALELPPVAVALAPPLYLVLV